MIVDIQGVITYRLLLKGKRSESVFRLREAIPVDIQTLDASSAPIACRIVQAEEEILLRSMKGRVIAPYASLDDVSAHPGHYGLQSLRSHGAQGSLADLEIRQIIATDKEEVSAEIQKNAEDFALVDGVLHRVIPEPVIIRRRIDDGDEAFCEFSVGLDNTNAIHRPWSKTAPAIHVYGIAEFEAVRAQIVGPADVLPMIDLLDPTVLSYDGRAHALREWAKLTLDEAGRWLPAGTRDFAECFFALRDMVEAMEEAPDRVSIDELIPCLEAMAMAPGRDGTPLLRGPTSNLGLVRHYEDTGSAYVPPQGPLVTAAPTAFDHPAPMI